MMGSLLFTILSFAVALGLLITVHEFGHYWVARRMGVKVLRFSIGFGKPLLRWRAGADQTEYVVAALPLGGYVRMVDEREGDVAEEDRARAFHRQPLKARFAIVAAGPFANFLFAIVAYWLMFTVGVAGTKPIVGEVVPDSYAERGGLRSGDLIISVSGRETPSWETAALALLRGAMNQEVVDVQVLDATERQRFRQLDLSSAPELLAGEGLFEKLGIRPWRPEVPPVLGPLEAGGAADRAGLQEGDRILSVDGIALRSWEQWAQYVRARPGEPLELEVQREGVRLALELRPRPVEAADGQVIGFIGASAHIPPELLEDMRADVRYGPLAAAGESFSKTWEMSTLTLRMLWKMVVGDASVKNISGPISIAQYAGQSASIGLSSFLAFLAIVSISLGILNLLPIPILDGGHLMYYLMELVKGSPVSEQAQIMGQKIGILMILGLMGLAFYNDFARLLG
jgi:regulator of sigma E protease